MRDTDVVFHCVSYVGTDHDQCRLVNEVGTRNITQAVQKSGAAALIYVSTAGVYGRGPLRGAGEGAALAPLSIASASRLFAEQEITAVSGIVLRPHLLYGVGDRWVVPLLCAAANSEDTRLRMSEALTSVLSVDELAQQLWAIATQKRIQLSRVYNADHGVPQSMREIADMCAEVLSAHEHPFRSRGVTLTEHQVAMLTEDNWFSSSLPRGLNYPPTRSFALTKDMVRWYSECV